MTRSKNRRHKKKKVIVPVKIIEDVNNECSICFEIINENEIEKEQVKHIPDFHGKCLKHFHKRCLDKWLASYGYDCPNCRTELKEKPKPIVEVHNNYVVMSDNESNYYDSD